MGDEHKEIELKLRVAPEDIAVIRCHPHFSSALHDSVHETLNSVYFDSDNRLLHRHGLALRVRHIDDKRIQTIKSTHQGADWIERSEWEQPIEGDQPDLARLTDAALRLLLTDGIRNALKPLFETRIERTACHLNGNDVDIVMAIDEGHIVAVDSSCPVSEIELELKWGDTGDLFKIARVISDIVPTQLDVKSKYERGFDLIEKKLVAAEKARNPELSAEMSAGRAFTMIGRACLHHLIVNTAATIDHDVEALHQMRVALRRLRAAILLFSEFLADDKIDAIKTELRWLAGEFGPARNVDTLIVEVLGPLRKAHPKEPGLLSIGKMFARQRLKCYRRAQEAVQSARFRKLVLNTAEWVEAGLWSRPDDPLKQARLEMPIEFYAAEQLSRRFKKVTRRGGKMGHLSSEQLHRLRIQVKKARYAAEFFCGIYRGNKATKRYKKMLSSLSQMQEALGRINDIVSHKALFAEIIANPRRGLTAAQNHRRAFAAGLIMGDQQARVHGLLDSARKAFSRFEDVKPFWRVPRQYGGVSQAQSAPAESQIGSVQAERKELEPQTEPAPH
jgi:triphosphatase